MNNNKMKYNYAMSIITKLYLSDLITNDEFAKIKDILKEIFKQQSNTFY